MAKDKMDFAQQNTERAMQATNWMRAIAEQNLNQSKAALEEFLMIARNAVPGADQQAAAAVCYLPGTLHDALTEFLGSRQNRSEAI